MMLSVILFAQIVTAPVAVPSAAPTAPATTLKTIVTVRSSALCTALRENVAPALVGLMQNDGLLGYGRTTFEGMSNEANHAPLESSFNQAGAAQAASSTPRMGEGFSHLYDLGRSIEHNVDTIDAILSDKTRFPDVPRTDDEKKLDQMKAELSSVVEQQRALVNVLSGTAETAMTNQLMAQPVGIGEASYGSVAASGIGGPLGGSSPIDQQEMASSPAFKSLMAVYATANSLKVGQPTPYDRMAALLVLGQRQIASSEDAASKAITAVAPLCRAGGP
jgi:hypothetical protein